MESLKPPLALAKAETHHRKSTLRKPDGTTADLTHDAADNLTRIQYSTGPDLHYNYDALDRLVSTKSIALTRDAEGQIINTDHFGRSYGATYENAGRLKTVSYNNGTLIATYTYSPTTGLLMSVSDNLSGARVDMVYNDDPRCTGCAAAMVSTPT